MIRFSNLEQFGLKRLVKAQLGECPPQVESLRKARQQAMNTPLLDLSSSGLSIPNNNRILAKLEMCCSPSSELSGSHYYRVYPYLLELLLRQGITPEDHALAEVSSGSAGQAFAHICQLAGFEAHCIFPNEISEKRRSLAAEHGGIIHLPDSRIDGFGLPGAVAKFKRLLAAKKINGKRLWSPNHADVIETAQALASIPLEILQQSQGLKVGSIDFFIGAAGNCSTLYSISSILRILSMLPKVIAFEPIESPGFFETKYPGRYEKEVGPLPDLTPAGKSIQIPMPGSGAYGLDFPYRKASVDLVDEVCLIKNNEWSETQELLKAQTGLDVGRTSAASLMLALQQAETVHDKNILVIFYDAGSNRY